MSYCGDQTHCENLDSVCQLVIGQAGCLLKDSHNLRSSQSNVKIVYIYFVEAIINFDRTVTTDVTDFRTGWIVVVDKKL